MEKLNFKNPVVKFILKAGGLYLIWLVVYYLLIKPYTDWDYYLNLNIVWLTHELMGFFGMLTYIDIESDMVVLIMEGGNDMGLKIGDQCNGFKLFSIFSIFIIAFPGSWKKKLWYIPLGLILIHFANVFRAACLVYINNYYPRYLDFNHLYTFTIFVYSIIFLLWYIWAKKHGGINAKG